VYIEQYEGSQRIGMGMWGQAVELTEAERLSTVKNSVDFPKHRSPPASVSRTDSEVCPDNNDQTPG
jgi:hypothetical protein